tara:strand:- start:261 stop:395 length:135 start_codon:yes stop_codon:yes gene_type:complete
MVATCLETSVLMADVVDLDVTVGLLDATLLMNVAEHLETMVVTL